jgi:hypothetical protein
MKRSTFYMILGGLLSLLSLVCIAFAIAAIYVQYLEGALYIPQADFFKTFSLVKVALFLILGVSTGIFSGILIGLGLDINTPK